MSDINNLAVRRILESLLERDLELYFFHKKYAMDLGELANAISYLQKNNLVILNNNTVSITKNGKIDLLINKRKYYKSKNKDWQIIPKIMLFDKLKKHIEIR